MDTLEQVSIEDLLEDECKCESLHNTPWNATCSVTVRWYVGHCVPAGPHLVCDDYARMCIMRRAISTCADCKRAATECWTIVPI